MRRSSDTHPRRSAEDRGPLRQILLACFALALFVGLGSRCSQEAPLPGDPAIYARIKASTDCAILQRDFEQARAAVQWGVSARHVGERSRIVGLSYMDAARDRMLEIGCHKQ